MAGDWRTEADELESLNAFPGVCGGRNLEDRKQRPLSWRTFHPVGDSGGWMSSLAGMYSRSVEFS